MNTWASSGKYDCNFLCVCVLGDRSAYPLAKKMSQQMKLTHCVNGFVDNDNDMPTYGQLGCKGFIVLDAEHRVVSNRTPAFMQVKDIAFAHVEALLDATIAKRAVPKVCPGDFISLQVPPTERPDLKGSEGMCVKVSESTVQFAFLDGPYRGRVTELPISAIGKTDEMARGGGGGCGPGGCGPAPGGCESGDCGQGKCGPDGCDGKGGCDGSGTLDEAFVASMLDLHSVKVASMDEEHAECADVLRHLVQGRSRAALEAVLMCLEDHFEHEEALFVEHNFGAHANENLSARKSHMDDHKRILDTIRSKLQGTKGAQAIPVDFIRALLQDFHDHTSRYDSQYAEPLSAKGAQ